MDFDKKDNSLTFPTARARGKKTEKTLSQVLKAIPGTGGFIQSIAARLGVDRRTVLNYRNRWAEVDAAINSEREISIDKAEVKLMELVESGNLKAIIYLLDNKGRDRGWGQKYDVKISGEPQTPVAVRQQIDLSGMSDSALAELSRALGGTQDLS